MPPVEVLKGIQSFYNAKDIVKTVRGALIVMLGSPVVHKFDDRITYTWDILEMTFWLKHSAAGLLRLHWHRPDNLTPEQVQQSKDGQEVIRSITHDHKNPEIQEGRHYKYD